MKVVISERGMVIVMRVVVLSLCRKISMNRIVKFLLNMFEIVSLFRFLVMFFDEFLKCWILSLFVFGSF